MLGYEDKVRRVCKLYTVRERISNALIMRLLEILSQNLHVYIPFLLLLSCISDLHWGIIVVVASLA